MIYFNNDCVDGWSIEDVESIRDSALILVNKGMHPRYDLVVKDLFKAANALLNEMKLDESRSFHSGNVQERPFITVIYEENQPDTYQGVKVDAGEESEVFFSDDFKQDITAALEKYTEPQFSSAVHSYIREAGIEL